MVGRKSRRAHGVAICKRPSAPDLSRAVVSNGPKIAADRAFGVIAHRGRGHTHAWLKTGAFLHVENWVIGAPSFSPDRSIKSGPSPLPQNLFLCDPSPLRG